MLREKIVFGPIRSRRLGRSLGINLLPEEGKICNFDCIYCECGWNRDGLGDTHIPSAEEVEAALLQKLRSCREEGVAIDSITFSGDGEPTLNPQFPEIVDITLRLRDEFYPEAVVSVLTNATNLSIPGVFEALRRVDKAILKLDAPFDDDARLINQPQVPYSVRQVVEMMKAFEGNFVLQTMLLQGAGFDPSSPEWISAWSEIVREVRPKEIMVYTIARETPQEGLSAFSADKMREMVKPLVEEGFTVKVFG